MQYFSEFEFSKSKRQKTDDLLCIGVKKNGDRCSSKHIKNGLYCKRHIPKVETTMKLVTTIDSSTNTEGTMFDIETANKLILEFIDDRVEIEKQMSELKYLNSILEDELKELRIM